MEYLHDASWVRVVGGPADGSTAPTITPWGAALTDGSGDYDLRQLVVRGDRVKALVAHGMSNSEAVQRYFHHMTTAAE